MTDAHHRPLWYATIGAFVLLAASAYGGPTQEMLDAIEKGKTNLWSKLNADGNWELVPQPQGNAEQGLEANQWGGQTAMVVYTLLNAGVDKNDARIKKAVEFLMQAKITGTYALSLRAMVWPKLQRTPAVVAAAKRDADQLWAMRHSEGKSKGFYTYKEEGKDGRFDLSNSQFAVLGLWSCAQVLPELPFAMWKELDDAWREQQTPEGRWHYQPGKDVEGKATMTFAGVATLYIMQDMLSAGKGAECKGNINDPAIDKGIAWLAANKPLWLVEPGWQPDIWTMEHYALYALSRVGIASGRKYIGGIDWLTFGAQKMVKGQKDDGSWGGVPNTCFAVLFLSRGIAPVAMNKLEYALDAAGDRTKPANWNERPRDVANIVKWLGDEIERNLNWQIVDLKADPAELLDAPVLYISGNQPLNFSKEEKDKLRKFVEMGGLILGNADCASTNFTTAFRKLGGELFPSYEFRELPADHVIYTRQQYQRSGWKNPLSVLGMSNGVRELMLLIPAADPARAWQLKLYRGREELHQIASDIVLYTVDKANLRYKGDSYVLAPNAAAQANGQLKVARLKYAGNWDPEPGGWRRQAILMKNQQGLDVEVTTVDVGAGKLDKTYKLAHLTGTAKLTLDAASRTAIKQFVDGGGTLLVDAAGGSSEFATSAENVLKEIFADSKGLAPLPAAHAIYTGPEKIEAVRYRPFAIKFLGNTQQPLLRGIEIGGRTAVIFSREDLSAGLVGQSVDGVLGYQPASAQGVVGNIMAAAAK